MPERWWSQLVTSYSAAKLGLYVSGPPAKDVMQGNPISTLPPYFYHLLFTFFLVVLPEHFCDIILFLAVFPQHFFIMFIFFWLCCMNTIFLFMAVFPQHICIMFISFLALWTRGARLYILLIAPSPGYSGPTMLLDFFLLFSQSFFFSTNLFKLSQMSGQVHHDRCSTSGTVPRSMNTSYFFLVWHKYGQSVHLLYE